MLARGGRKSTRADTVQSELDDLQKKYRMMEVNRKNFSEDSQNTIRMQRQQIEKLKKVLLFFFKIFSPRVVKKVVVVDSSVG